MIYARPKMRMNTKATIVIFALVSAFGLLGVIAVDSFIPLKVDATGIQRKQRTMFRSLGTKHFFLKF